MGALSFSQKTKTSHSTVFQSVTLVGTSHRKRTILSIAAHAEALSQPRLCVVFQKEPNNEYDSNAIKVRPNVYYVKSDSDRR